MRRFLDAREAAQICGLAPATLAKRRVVGGPGCPPFVKLGSKVLYDSADLADWLAAQPRLSSTSDSAPVP